MRPLIVLALAPLLALGIALGAGRIVPDKAPKATLKPKAIVWDNRVFTSRSTFARWLSSRDKSYQVWVKRHPGATWFHKVRAPAPHPKLAAPPATRTKSNGGGGTDTGLVILVGLGGLVLGGVIMRILPAATAGAANRRQRPLRPSPASLSVGVPRRLALPAAKPTPPRSPPVETPPRVQTAPAAATEPARVVPLYVPPAPEPEVAPALEPERVAASALEPQPIVAPAPSPPVEPEPARAVNGEPLPAPVAEPVRLAEPVPVAAPEPEPVAVPAAEPGPPLHSPPAEELLEPAAAEPEPEPAVERPARTTVMPASAPAGTNWHMCEIALWEGYVKSQFYARVTTSEGDEYALAFSPLFRVRNPFARDEVARSAHVQLAQQLLEEGWKPDGRGKHWWELRFTLQEAES